ncbi:MAG: hypothetical protein K9N23_20285 [Akkermansiaceae bacterium]|nr:hypothetical protein [Akkermansiaceae bacterium]
MAGKILQDATLMATRMMESAEKAGRKFTTSNISYYAERAARRGRRSYYTGRSDLMSAGCQMDVIRPGWESDLRLARERHLCHTGWPVAAGANQGNQGNQSSLLG